MDFRKIKRLHSEYQAEMGRLSENLTLKFKRKISVNPTSDGLCVMFADQDETGVSLEEFERLMKVPGFDTLDIVTVL